MSLKVINISFWLSKNNGKYPLKIARLKNLNTNSTPFVIGKKTMLAYHVIYEQSLIEQSESLKI